MMSPLGYAREGPALKGRVGFLLHALAETSESQPASTRRGGLECMWEGNLDVVPRMLNFAPLKRGTARWHPAWATKLFLLVLPILSRWLVPEFGRLPGIPWDREFRFRVIIGVSVSCSKVTD